ncbi:putative conserved protein YraI [Goodfellowiella coeruleoviolacea]|uniref:Conserved protein YraI n=2 Tax=Goodfellowiella coeruleoviolacea TaxID=334858 RepID=A0AAE3GHB7_9PSEU|nr:hypothetical protein [Goodfellowiella coeruleoviolacea]MCP2168256.1 putative conserved protein YraI [Goodfellowiella coeruleoviolacea]
MRLRPKRMRQVLVTFLATAAVTLVGANQAWAAATGTVRTDSGVAVTVRATPSTSATAVGSAPNGTVVSIECQAIGETVTGKYGTSDLWDYVPALGGYITDTYVYTGADGRVAPDCTGDGGGDTPTACSTTGLGNPRTCAQAVAWAKEHVHTNYNGDYYRWCDRINAWAYGWSASGSETAYKHWTQIPSSYKYPGSYEVPAGGLAFFSNGGSGHTMISIGGGKFLSNDIHGNGTYTETTIAEIKSQWGATYLGWAQPWFKINH